MLRVAASPRLTSKTATAYTQNFSIFLLMEQKMFNYFSKFIEKIIAHAVRNILSAEKRPGGLLDERNTSRTR